MQPTLGLRSAELKGPLASSQRNRAFKALGSGNFLRRCSRTLKDAHPTDVSTFGENEHLREPDDDLRQKITDLLSRHPKGLSNEEVAIILKAPLIKVEAVRGDHG